ncbi:MAG: thioredoxin family protein [Salibacteraceae bacterium]|nr:thioredoxin family protein [Salibacteraceae bacterium]|tara:strand:- start:2071 stop:2628 length:558 start_codon:yes stop_codon:yes gene_type:complete
MNKKILFGSILVIFLIGTAFVSIDKVPNENFENTVSANSAAPEGELKWYVDLSEAQVVAKETNKPIFAFFTGSDWCGWCKRLQATVFLKPSFKEWANSNVVLLELDFPRRKQLPPKIAEQNNQLKGFFQPKGYPTIWLFDMNLNAEGTQYEINALGNLGYPSGSQPGQEDKKFIANADQILAKRQ